jgi:tetratricopeptide (TPR) repeat protein
VVSKIKDSKRRAQVSYGLFALGLLVAAYASFSLLSPGGYLREAYLSRSTEARPLVWQLSERAIADRPFLGWGGDNFERVYEQYYDNRVLEQKYGDEAWFDRAHNVLVDQLVDNGLIGLFLYLVAYIVVILSLIYAALHAEEKNDRLLSSILIVYFALHLAELQTAFDTSISYPLLAFMFVSAAILYHRARAHVTKKNLALELPLYARYALGSGLICFFLWSLIFGAFPLSRAEFANGAIRRAGSSEKRIPYYTPLFDTPLDKQTFLWRTETDFERGIGQDPSVLNNPKKVKGLEEELVLFEHEYQDFVEKNPSNYRAHLGLADVLMYQNLFHVDKLSDAQHTLDEAIALYPQIPQAYWMKAVGYLYMRKFDLAREYAKKALDLNPDIVESQNVVRYVNDSIGTFPNIDLYFFTQI